MKKQKTDKYPPAIGAMIVSMTDGNEEIRFAVPEEWLNSAEGLKRLYEETKASYLGVLMEQWENRADAAEIRESTQEYLGRGWGLVKISQHPDTLFIVPLREKK